jgi:hypothetical protein
MSELSEDVKFELAGRNAVVMHIEAYRKVGRITLMVTIVCVVLAIYISNYWLLAIPVPIYFAIFHYVINSCVRFVERQSGIPAEVQIQFNHRYKTDAKFKQEVDEMHKRVSNLAGLH